MLKKTVVTILVVIGLALVLAGLSLLVRPDWLGIPGGLLLLIGVAFLAVSALGGYLKDWREFLFGSLPEKRTPDRSSPERSQLMKNSERGRQEMHGKGGKQTQDMEDSPDGKQIMD
jgi:hypothetical protein